MKKIGLCAFSFALTDNEPNEVNIRLAHEAVRLTHKVLDDGNEPVICSQWEIAKELKRLGIIPALIINEHGDGPSHYLCSEEVVKQSATMFKNLGVNEVVAVAQPFLHLHQCRKHLRKYGFKALKEKIIWVGFLKESKQWGTRSALHCFGYALLQFLFGKKGH